MAQKLLIIDTDCGIDDALAIIVALAAPGVKVLGITCCFGNTDVDNVFQNVMRVLTVCQQTQIPVFKGSAGPLIGPVTGFKDHFGTDGLGDVLENSEVWKGQIQKEHAVHAMIKLVNENQGEVSLIALGPLTNLALAVRLDPSLPQKLKDLYIMGGNMEGKKISCCIKTGHIKRVAANCTFYISEYYGLHKTRPVPRTAQVRTLYIELLLPTLTTVHFPGKGNLTPSAEFNFSMDAESAYVVLEEYTCSTHIATWEFTCRNKLSWDCFEELVNQDTSAARFIKMITSKCWAYSREPHINNKDLLFGNGFVPYDAFAVAACVDSSVITERLQCAVRVEVQGQLGRGMMVVDAANTLKKGNLAFVMRTCDLKKFSLMLKAALQIA